jgi:hypothetical protein
MNKLAISLIAGASALLASSAFAAPLSNGISVLPDGNIEQVRMVCNENGRCWRERGERRVIVRESYGYDRGRRYDDGRRDGVAIRTPGVTVGIGTGRY